MCTFQTDDSFTPSCLYSVQLSPESAFLSPLQPLFPCFSLTSHSLSVALSDGMLKHKELQLPIHQCHPSISVPNPFFTTPLPLSTVAIHFRLPPELQKRLVSLLSSPVEQLQVLSSAVLRETLPLSGQELNYNQENIGQLNSHAAALLLSQVGSDAYVVFGFIRIYFELYVGF